MATTIELQIRNQHWLGEPHEQSHDGCSHGGIRDDDESGISQSALSLLRSLDRDHTPTNLVIELSAGDIDS